jgi:serine-threonine kinase receptor-associated protein
VSPPGCVAKLIIGSRIWDPQSGECLSVLSHNHIVKAVAFPIQKTPQVVATGGQEKKLRIWDLTLASSMSEANGDRPREASNLSEGLEIGVNNHTASLKSIVWNVDYNIITTAADDKTIRWYDLRTAQQPIATYKTERDITSCELSTNKAEDNDPGIMSVAAGQSALFFDAGRPGQLLKKVDFDHSISSVAVSPSTGRFVTGGSNDTWVRVWDLEPEKQLGMYFTQS